MTAAVDIAALRGIHYFNDRLFVILDSNRYRPAEIQCFDVKNVSTDWDRVNNDFKFLQQASVTLSKAERADNQAVPGRAGVFVGLARAGDNFYLINNEARSIERYDLGKDKDDTIEIFKDYSNEATPLEGSTRRYPRQLEHTELDPDAPIRVFNNLYHFYYHHDMYGTSDEHLRPSTFIYSVLKSARIRPAFTQAGDEIAGQINNHKMQLIENTKQTYRYLLSRVLPTIGYILRFKGDINVAPPGQPEKLEGGYELFDLIRPRNPEFQFGDNMIQILNIEYNAREQFSSFIFENHDMLRGDNTLEEFKQPGEFQSYGRYTIFNSNPFSGGKTLTLETGTWIDKKNEAEYNALATVLSARSDLYIFRVPNSFFITEEYKIVSPVIGDRVRLTSVKIPNESGEVDVLIMGRSQSELYTEFRGLSFQQ